MENKILKMLIWMRKNEFFEPKNYKISERYGKWNFLKKFKER